MKPLAYKILQLKELEAQKASQAKPDEPIFDALIQDDPEPIPSKTPGNRPASLEGIDLATLLCLRKDRWMTEEEAAWFDKKGIIRTPVISEHEWMRR